MEKDTRKKTKKMILTALMAAFTCIATMIIKIPTPTLGYIHLGDGLVLLCGFMLGPAPGALAAGTGSMFADIFSGYRTGPHVLSKHWPQAPQACCLQRCLNGFILHAVTALPHSQAEFWAKQLW